MIMITPTETEQVLAPFLDAAGAILELPVHAFFGEKEFASDIRSHSVDRLLL